jgi:hypothetical protein
MSQAMLHKDSSWEESLEKSGFGAPLAVGRDEPIT